MPSPEIDLDMMDSWRATEQNTTVGRARRPIRHCRSAHLRRLYMNNQASAKLLVAKLFVGLLHRAKLCALPRFYNSSQLILKLNTPKHTSQAVTPRTASEDQWK